MSCVLVIPAAAGARDWTIWNLTVLRVGGVRLGSRRKRRRSMMARPEPTRYSTTRGLTSYTSPWSLKNPMKGVGLYISRLQPICSIM